MPFELETEFKLLATRPIEIVTIEAEVRAAGFTWAASDSARHVDVYLDDGCGSMTQGGVGLRLRSDRLGQRLTCKRAGRRGHGLFVRRESTTTWSADAAPATALDLPPELRDEVEPFTMDRALAPLLRLETLRDSRVLQCDGQDLCELAIDRVEASAQGRSTTFQEVELEVLDDLPSNEYLATTLTERLPLRPASDDKPAHATKHLGLPRRATPPRRLRDDTPIGAAMAAITSRHLTEMGLAEVGVRRDHDPESVHEMRVAVRRLRAIVRAFRDVWPDEASLDVLDHLGDTGRRLGTVRDLDVMLASLPAAIAQLPGALRDESHRLVRWLQGRREVAQNELLDWLRSPQRIADCARVQQRLSTVVSVTGVGAAALATDVHSRLERAVRAVRKLAADIDSDLPTEPLHRLRIASKRLRYLAEEFVDLPVHHYARSVAAVTRLQQALGNVCDHELAAKRLLDWLPACAATSENGLLLAAAVGGLAANHTSAAGRARRAAWRCLRRVDRKKVWRRFVASR